MVSYNEFESRLVKCRRCPRLVEFREAVAIEKRKSFMDWDYWGKPVPGYGDILGRLLLVGLAPARHGGNRTGRVFTGDKSADFLMACLYKAGIASQPNSDNRDDGLVLHDTYMTPVLKCVPPQDKPTAEELRTCFEWMKDEMVYLENVKCVLALGKIAFDTCIKFWQEDLGLKKKDYPFGHNVIYKLSNGISLVGAYHPSPRNVNTGRLNEKMMLDLIGTVKGLLVR